MENRFYVLLTYVSRKQAMLTLPHNSVSDKVSDSDLEQEVVIVAGAVDH